MHRGVRVFKSKIKSENDLAVGESFFNSVSAALNSRWTHLAALTDILIAFYGGLFVGEKLYRLREYLYIFHKTYIP